jgi:hypothetical protein
MKKARNKRKETREKESLIQCGYNLVTCKWQYLDNEISYVRNSFALTPVWPHCESHCE